MTTTSQSTKRKLSLLQLAEELGNGSKACKIMGYHRDTFYEGQKAFKVGGVAALFEKIQSDLDVFIEFYNLKRNHQGYRLKGSTPAQALREAPSRKKLPPITPKEDVTAAPEAA